MWVTLHAPVRPYTCVYIRWKALDKETLDKESRVWNPVELQSWIGHGYRHRPHLIRNPPGSGPSGWHSLSNAPTVYIHMYTHTYTYIYTYVCACMSTIRCMAASTEQRRITETNPSRNPLPKRAWALARRTHGKHSLHLLNASFPPSPVDGPPARFRADGGASRPK